MQSDYAADPGVTVVMQLLPIMIFQIIYAVVVFQLCRKQNWNAFLWTVLTLVPVLGMIVFIVVFLSTMLKTLDRLNAIEGKTR